MQLNRPIVSPILVGRSRHRASLDSLAAAAGNGQGQTVLVSGEAGIGKSRLVSELARDLAAGGWLVLRGDCYEPDRSVPYAAWLEPAQRLLALASERDRSRFLAHGGPGARRLFPDVVDAAGGTPDLAADKHALFRSLFELIASRAAAAPIALVVEDVHWADESSLELAIHIARRIGDRRVLFVLTYREDEVGESLSRLLAELDRGRLATELRLEALSADEAQEMVRATLGPGRPLESALAGRVFALAEGNPFFIEELLRSLGDRGPTPDADDDARIAIPRSVREAVRQRSSALTPDARRLVRLAAVVGRRFDFALLAALAGLEEAAVVTLVKELVGAQLIVEEPADRFRFRHALTREAIYSELLARERQPLHDVIASTFEKLYADAGSARAGDVGYHFFEARRFVKALEYCRAAGERAERMWAPRAAVEHYSRAVAAARELSQPPSVALLRARGRAYEAVGDFDRAIADQELALATARLNDDRRAEWQALVDLGMLWASRSYERSGEYYAQAFSLAEALGDDSLIAHSLNRVGNWHVNRERPVEGIDHHRRALNLFEALDDRHGIAATLDLLGMACILGSDQVQGIDYYRRAALLLRELDDRVGLASCLASMTLYGRSNLQQDVNVPSDLTPAEALQFSDEAQKLSAEIGLRSGEAFALWNRAAVLGALGEYSAAIATASRGLEIAEEIGHEQWIVGACCALGFVYLELFCFDLAQACFRRMKGLSDEIGSVLWTLHAYASLALTRAAQGDDAEADALLGQVLKPDTPAHGLGERVAWTKAAELALLRGDHARALAIVERVKADSLNVDRGPTGIRVSWIEGTALLGLGRLDEAEAPLQQARDLAAADDIRGRLWRTEAALAQLYRRTGRQRDADAASGRAREIVASLLVKTPEALRAPFLAGARSLLPDLRSLGRAPGPRAEGDALTSRERSVADLVAQGLSNRAIAERLVVSERTVETHVSNILGKLGFTSRAQIAAWAASQPIALSPRAGQGLP